MAEPALQPTTGASAARRLPTEAELPCEDGKPLAETDYQLKPLGYAYYGLDAYFADRADVAVQADMFVYYQAAGGRLPYRSLAPDVFVSFGVPKRDRRSYVVWAEGKPPDFVLEVLSPSTWRRDMGEKKAEYERMGVREYWVYGPVDPEGSRQLPFLAAFTLADGAYQSIAPEDAGGLAFASRVLGLVLRVRDGTLRIEDSATGEEFLTPGELAVARRRAEAAWKMAERRADASEAARETAERQADANEAARETAERRADASEAAREAAERRADEHEAARDAAEAARKAAQERIAQLEAQLRKRR